MRDWLRRSEEVRIALAEGRPVVALESTVLAHGLPRPRNLETGRALEEIVRRGGAVPATIAVLDGTAVVGLDDAQLERISMGHSVEKLSTRDLGSAHARGITGATTVAATAHLARRAGIDVFATGGIGGVHRGAPLDISADLTELQRTPVLVVCAGAKSILDLPATREMLETLGIPVYGWRTGDFPGFHVAATGLPVDLRVDSAAELAAVWRAHRVVGTGSAVLLCAPIPPDAALPPDLVDSAVESALAKAAATGVRGKELTPYLLTELTRATEGRTVDANVALLCNNAAVAAEAACAIAP